MSFKEKMKQFNQSSSLVDKTHQQATGNKEIRRVKSFLQNLAKKQSIIS